MNHIQSRAKMFAVVLGLGIAATLTLSGCSFPSAGGSASSDGSSDGSDSSDSGSSDSTTPPGDINLDELQGVPDTFPKDVPIIDGDVPVGVDLGTGWSIVVKVDDFAASYIEASGKLTGAGFEVLQDGTSVDGSFGAFQNDKYQVQITASNTNDYGPALSYVVVLVG